MGAVLVRKQLCDVAPPSRTAGPANAVHGWGGRIGLFRASAGCGSVVVAWGAENEKKCLFGVESQSGDKILIGGRELVGGASLPQHRPKQVGI